MNPRFQTRRITGLLSLCLLPLFSACTLPGNTVPPEDAYISSVPSPTPAFEEFATELFCREVSSDTLSLHYTLVHPEHYGIPDTAASLGTFIEAVSPDESAVSLYERLLLYENDSLTKEEQLTYDVLERHLNLLMEDSFSPYLSELLGPVTGFQAQLPILLAEFRLEDSEDIEKYLELLPQVYSYFEQIASFEKEKSRQGYFMDDTTAKEIIAQCKDFVSHPDDNFLISTFSDRLAVLDLSLAEKTDYILRNQTALFSYVFPAYELLITTLTECLGTGTNPYGLSHYENGAAYYSRLIKCKTGSDKTPEELIPLLTSAVDQSFLGLATALSSDSALYEAALNPKFPVSDPNEIMRYIIDKSVLDFPKTDCGDFEFKYVPEALQDYVSPAMFLTPPIDQYEPNVIYINPNPVFNADSLFPTIVHEGYPGHLYQTVSTLSGKIHPLRYLLSPVGYEEGFATYAEHYCYKYAGFSDSLTLFLQEDQKASLCLYALSDLYVHYQGYTPEQLSALLSVYGFPKETSDIIYQTVLSEPGSYLPYAVGFLEFLELRDLARELWKEDYSDLRFHTFLLTTGPMPFALLQAELNLQP